MTRLITFLETGEYSPAYYRLDGQQEHHSRFVVDALARLVFVTRHPGAVEWARRRGLQVDRPVEHLDVADIYPGDVVIGSLPVNLAAEVCDRGACYIHLSLRLPAEWRGRELSADDMERFGARLETCHIQRVEEAP